jgi:iron complex transport system ATP-binding protein
VNDQDKKPAFLELRNVHVARGDKTVLHDVQLTIESGESVAILGPNGCGKSTLIKTITCETYPLELDGKFVRIFGKERWEVSLLRKHLGLVSADLPGRSIAGISGFEAVVTGFFGSAKLWEYLDVTEAMKSAATDALALLQSEHLAEKLVGEMSAGELRRVMIARALVHKPEMLLLDEPTNALDLAAQRELREILQGVAQKGTGIVMVTHHLADILPEMKRVVLMKHGRIFADGLREELLKPQVLSELFGVPVEIAERDGFLHSW